MVPISLCMWCIRYRGKKDFATYFVLVILQNEGDKRQEYKEYLCSSPIVGDECRYIYLHYGAVVHTSLALVNP